MSDGKKQIVTRFDVCAAWLKADEALNELRRAEALREFKLATKREKRLAGKS